ncbi:hypothetical protein [Desulfonatronum thioautotrophicum]|uniref:hypothetical protein n=1 Tax=Desulfonatronum thioautotrophicum TaxID=617001 RepID=UPI0005EBDA59|nr:hypothetical protein [Desulfonatronum thioautotrophicum]
MSTNGAEVVLGFSPHYLEAIPGILSEMGKADTIALEEPNTPGFLDMLAGKLSIPEYLLQMDTDFPRFAAELCEGLQDLHAQGKRIVQMDPFLDRLVTIHECFAANLTPDEVLSRPELRDVYLAEKNATGALLRFYDLSAGKDFQAIVDSVKHFAKLDADRIRLRDALRAEAILSLIAPGRRVYVEAGYMHFGILQMLQRRNALQNTGHDGPVQRHKPEYLPAFRVHPRFILQPIARRLHVRHRNMGPGDLLTLHFIFHPDADHGRADLLAARSLIAIRLVNKEELVPGPNRYPQSEDDATVNNLVKCLDYERCRSLYERIHRAPRATALRYARQMLSSHRPSQCGASIADPQDGFASQKQPGTRGARKEHA